MWPNMFRNHTDCRSVKLASSGQCSKSEDPGPPSPFGLTQDRLPNLRTLDPETTPIRKHISSPIGRLLVMLFFLFIQNNISLPKGRNEQSHSTKTSGDDDRPFRRTDKQHKGRGTFRRGVCECACVLTVPYTAFGLVDH